MINIASILGLRVGKALAHYAVAKAGVVQLTKAMAMELAKNKIRVNAIAPGYFRTEMNSDYFDTEHGQNYVRSKVPMARLGQLEELDGPLPARQRSRLVHDGTIINVDGGHVNNSL
ncbi:SDR family oxidoreductase [Halopseudomonas pachastrellae]|nr:SDR family oxidoreductase [Halopseudomonas pachastrellae]